MCAYLWFPEAYFSTYLTIVLIFSRLKEIPWNAMRWCEITALLRWVGGKERLKFWYFIANECKSFDCIFCVQFNRMQILPVVTVSFSVCVRFRPFFQNQKRFNLLSLCALKENMASCVTYYIFCHFDGSWCFIIWYVNLSQHNQSWQTDLICS